MKRQISFQEKLPSPKLFPLESVLFYDSVLDKIPYFKSWSAQFKYKIALKSGENLKTLNSLNLVLSKVTSLKVPQTTQLTFIAVGGGSVGDFVGFLASIYLRGRSLILIPSTWLAAVDSAHGGKTGLNFQDTKNQLGTFYPAEYIYVCKKLLSSQPPIRLKEALGEIIKIAILSDKKLFQDLENQKVNLSDDWIFKKLPQIINLKYKIVNSDPFEKKGNRRLLNLGHTMGHVFESYYQWPHGICVLLGMQFSLRWSFHKKLINEKNYIRISELLSQSTEFLSSKQNLQKAILNLKTNDVIQLILKDKKLTNRSQLDFIFIKNIGSCTRLSVFADVLIDEIQRQKKVY